MSTATIQKRGAGTKKPKKIPLPRTPRMVDTKYMGLEPEMEGLDLVDNDTRLSLAYNWYNHFYGLPEAKKWAIEHYTKTSPAIAKMLQKVPEAQFSTTFGWLCRMKERGIVVPPQTRIWINQKLTELTKIADAVVEKKVVREAIHKGYSPPPHDQLIADFEDMLDAYYVSGYTAPFDPYDYLQKNDVKKAWAKALADHYRPLMDELKLVMSKKDKQAVEGYSKLTKQQFTGYAKLVHSIIEDAERWYANKAKITKTARAPKKKSTEQLLRSFKYMKDLPALKVVSIDPATIIGATTLYAYNHKYKKLMVYTAETGKNLRKPEMQLPHFLNGTAPALKKRYGEITSKPSVSSGRISEDVLLIKVFK